MENHLISYPAAACNIHPPYVLPAAAGYTITATPFP